MRIFPPAFVQLSFIFFISMLNIKYTYKKKVTKHPLLVIHRHTVYLLSMRPLCGGMGMLPVALSLPLAEDCASKKEKKKSSWRHLFPRKKKKKRKKNPHPPHRCERRSRRQTSAQSCGSYWLAVCTKSKSNHFTHNTPTNPKGVHAASSITSPLLSHRFQT